MKPSDPSEPAHPRVDVDTLMEQVRTEVEQWRASSAKRSDEQTLSSGVNVNPLSTEEIMARVRAEVARRREGVTQSGISSASASTPAPPPEIVLPRWRPAAARLAAQPQYVLADFLRFDDADFIDVVYAKLLKRPADPDGSRGYLEALRSGALSKVEILGLIRFSEEGRKQSVHVDGLLLPYKLHRWRHVRVIGWFLGMGMAIARLPRLAWRVQGIEAAAARETQELGRLVDRVEDVFHAHLAEADRTSRALRAEMTQLVVSRVEGLRAANGRIDVLQAAVSAITERVQASEAERSSQQATLQAALNATAERVQASDVERSSQQAALQTALDAIVERLRAGDVERSSQYATLQEVLAAHEARHAAFGDALQTRTAELHGRIETMAATFTTSAADNANKQAEVTNRLAVQDAALARLGEQTRSDQSALRAMLDRLTVFLDASARRVRKGEDEVTGGDDPSLEEQYALFEQTFRGEREEIKLRAGHYLDVLTAAGVEPGDNGIVLDLGSGRGEWLEVLADNGYHGRGVDANRGMLKASAARGHDVVESDALEYLHAQPDGLFVAVTSMHMVEHMPYPVVIQLLDEALRVLRPGGVLILETPNPENVLVGSCLFYMDPSHLHPIPPALLQWTVQARGFEGVVIERLTEHRGLPDLAPVSDQVPGAAQINQMVGWFTAPPDYAVIATKPYDSMR